MTVGISIGDLTAGVGATTKTFAPDGKHPRAATASAAKFRRNRCVDLEQVGLMHRVNVRVSRHRNIRFDVTQVVSSLMCALYGVQIDLSLIVRAQWTCQSHRNTQQVQFQLRAADSV